MIITPSNLSNVITAFEQENKPVELLIHKELNGDYTIKTQAYSWWMEWLPWVDNPPHMVDSVKNLKEIIGERRLKAIFARDGINLDLNKLENGTLHLTKEVMQKIFLGLGDIRESDLSERLNGKEIKDLSVEEMDKTYRSLMPFEKVEDVFFGSIPEISYYDKAMSSGKGYWGLRERVWVVLKAWQQFSSNSSPSIKQDLTDAEFLTSRLADREPPVGTIIRRPQGYFVVDRVFSAWGSYVSGLRGLTKGTRPMLLCRGTATRLRAVGGFFSGISDLFLEIGFGGIRKIWDDVKTYLDQSPSEEVDVYGKSLGGGHAQYLTALITAGSKKRVHTLTTYCSIGTPQRVQKAFNKALEKTSNKEPTVNIVRNGSDFVPLVGGPHLHASAEKTHVYYITGEGARRSDDPCIRHNLGCMPKTFRFLRSFPFNHLRQTTMEDFSYVEVNSDSDEELKRGTELEFIRKIAAHIFNILTFGIFNKISFKDFYHKVNIL